MSDITVGCSEVNVIQIAIPRFTVVPPSYTVQVENPNTPLIIKNPSITVTVEQPANSPHIVVPVSGPAGPPGSGTTTTATTAQALSGHRLVVPNSLGQLIYADSSNDAHMHSPVWLTTSAWSSGVTATVATFGAVEEPTWSWTPGLPLFMGLDGFMVQSLPPESSFYRRVGAAITATSIFFDVDQPLDIL